jgi:hypothetical protein
LSHFGVEELVLLELVLGIGAGGSRIPGSSRAHVSKRAELFEKFRRNRRGP